VDPRSDETANTAPQPDPGAAPAPDVDGAAAAEAAPAVAPLTDQATEPPGRALTEPLTDADTAPAVEPVAATAAPSAGRSRTRWLIGGGLAVAAVAAIALGASFLAASPLPEVFKYLPADSAVVVEIRPELPGDQRQHLGNFLAHFPGFEDQSTLDEKIDEVLERITRESTSGEVDYATQVEPLLAGPMAVSVTSAAVSDAMTGGTPDGILFVATTDGSATCTSIFGLIGETTTYRSVDVEAPAGFGAAFGTGPACAVHERYLLVGTAASIRDGIDARLDGKNVATNATYKAARSKLEGDQVASVFLDMDPLYDALRDLAIPQGMAFGEFPEGLWVIEGLRVTDDAVILDTWAPAAASTLPSGAPTTAPATESRFATSLPSDTLGYLELHGVGASVEQVLAVVGAEPTMAESLRALEDALLILGGTDNLTGWIEDLAVAIVPTDDSVGGAVLIRGTDAETAKARLVQIRNLLVLGSTGTDITMRDSDHNGVTVTTVDLGDASALLGGAGFPGAGDTGRLEIAFAARDDLVVIAGGGGIVERILDVEASSSLATSATYGKVIDIAGTTNDMQLFVALDATLTVVERFLPADQLDMWTTEFKPYLDHLAGVAMTSLAQSSGGHSRVVITVK
jgi:hypothetical protein